MPNYRRPLNLGRPIFFTLCLADRASTALIDHLDVLREAVRVVKRDRPFEILAFVVLPNHLHAVWRVPTEDPNYSQRWGRIKSRFSRDARRAGLLAPCDRGKSGGTSPALRTAPGYERRAGFIPPPGSPRKGETGIWQRRFWGERRSAQRRTVQRTDRGVNGQSPGREAVHCRDDRDLDRHIQYCWLNPVKHGFVERPVEWGASSFHRDIRRGRIDPKWFGAEPEGVFGEIA